MEWQPIETAPKDTYVIVWYDHDADPRHEDSERHTLTNYASWTETVGSWLEGKGVAVAKLEPQQWEATDEYGGGFWLPSAWFVQHLEEYVTVCNATHWMPLPAPPEA